MAVKPKLPPGNSARRLFVLELVKRVGRLDMDNVWTEHQVPSHIVRSAVKELEQSGLVKVERDRWVGRK